MTGMMPVTYVRSALVCHSRHDGSAPIDLRTIMDAAARLAGLRGDAADLSRRSCRALRRKREKKKGNAVFEIFEKEIAWKKRLPGKCVS